MAFSGFSSTNRFVVNRNDTDTQTFTVSIWGYFVSNGANEDTLCGNWDSDTSLQWVITRNAGNNMVFAMRDAGNFYMLTVPSSETPANGTWGHLCFYFNGTTLKGYINGTEAASAGTSGSGLNSTNAIIGIGCRSDETFPWYGAAAEFALWNDVALSSSQIAALAKGASPFLVRKPAVYCPLIKDGRDLVARSSLMIGSPTDFPHPRIYQ